MAESVKKVMFPKDQNEQIGNWINCGFFVAENLFGPEVFYYMRPENCDLLEPGEDETILFELSDVERTLFMISVAATKMAQEQFRNLALEEIDRMRRSAEAIRSLFWAMIHSNYPDLPEGGNPVRAGFKLVRKSL